MIPCFFHPDQLAFKPVYEWAFGEKIDHPETTARAENILAALKARPELFEMRAPKAQPLSALRDAHNYNLLTLYNTARQLPEDETFYPSVFPRDPKTKGDPTTLRQAGCFCFDSGTPLNNRTFDAAAWSAACAYEGARLLKKGEHPVVYALSRPPGHHATKDHFGGYSYFNNSGIAARYLRRSGRVAVLDIDFHHGNGTQSMFYRDDKVLTISIHGDPGEFYPFYCGFQNETGAGRGVGYNLNFSLPAKTTFKEWMQTLEQDALPAIQNFAPDYLIVAAGFDTYRLDPIGDFEFYTADYTTLGARIAELGYPTLVVQEGGYYTPDLGANVAALLEGTSRLYNF